MGVTPKLLLTRVEAAEALSLCEKTLYTLTKQGKLRAIRIGASVRYDLEDLRAFVNQQKRD